MVSFIPTPKPNWYLILFTMFACACLLCIYVFYGSKDYCFPSLTNFCKITSSVKLFLNSKIKVHPIITVVAVMS